MQLPLPLVRDLVLVGGGHSHALVLRMWGMRPLPGVRVTLVNPGPTAPYSGMLPGLIAGHYSREMLEIDLVRLGRFAGARLVVGAVTGIDRRAKRIHVDGHSGLRYDVASIDIGINTSMPVLPGFAEHAIPAKPLDAFADAWEEWCARLQRGDVQPDACVIGAGVAGVELALAMRHRSRQLGRPAHINLVDAANALDGSSRKTRAVLLERLRHEDIELHETSPVAEVTANDVRLTSGQILRSSFTLGAAGARPHDWVRQLDLEAHDGYLTVDPHLRSVTDPTIFASGDCAHLGFAPRPKAGVYAVRAAPILFHNLQAALGDGSLRRFRPQKDYLKLISLGKRAAVADRSGLTLTGKWLWRWKDRIDRTFMAKFHDLPAMPPPPLPRHRAAGMDAITGDQPLCGGCGAKVGGADLHAALARLPAPRRADVKSLPGDDAAIIETGAAVQVLTTDHLRAFTEDPAVFARITAIHALGDIWAMGAAPQAVLANITLPPMRAELLGQTLAEILDAATAVFRAEGADLVGGHTSVGAELSLGFTITGLASAAPITQSGALPGDALLLTKPIGSGTVLAAEMQGRARGADVLATLAGMSHPQGTAARLLAGAHAMTDVTGFGLAGHLMAVCEASGVAADITLADVPFYPGARDLAAQGIRSTLAPANRAVSQRMAFPDDPASELLFDPQTAGGLLAAVDPSGAADLLDRLRAAGFDARRIGTLTDDPPFITVR